MVSIIIPVYNISAYLEKCICSCIEQTFTDIEIIIVNDGSTDDSLSVINRFAQQDSRIIIVNKKNEGLLFARKSGVEIAKGEYIFHLDGDDYIEKDTIESLYNAASVNHSDITACGFFIDGDQSYIPVLYPKDGIWDRNEFLHYGIDIYYLNIWGKLIKRYLYDSITFIPSSSLGEDVIQLVQLCYSCHLIYVLNKPLYHYVYRENSATNNTNFISRANTEIAGAKSFCELIKIVSLDINIRRKIIYIILARICYFLRITGSYGTHETWIKQFIRSEYFNIPTNRLMVFKRSKFIYFMLFIAYFSPKLANMISKLRVLIFKR